MSSSSPPLILIRGAGDLGSGVAFRLHRAGFLVVMTELPKPLVVRRPVSFGSAVFEATGIFHVENITARVVESSSSVWLARRTREIPIIVDTDGSWRLLKPQVVIDARVAKRNIDTTIGDAVLVIALGPGFTAGYDCHAVIETNRGHRLGRVIWDGTAEPNTGIPGTLGGVDQARVLRAPCDGYVEPIAAIGDALEPNQPIARVEEVLVESPFKGVLRGLIHESVPVKAKMKIGDVDPRGNREHSFTISDKALAIGGGVLEAILSRGFLPERGDLDGEESHAFA